MGRTKHYKEWTMPKLIRIRHDGQPFVNSDRAVLAFTGVTHHYVWLLT